MAAGRRRVVATALALASLALLVYWLGRVERPPIPIGAIVLAAASLLALVVPAPRVRRRRRARTARGSRVQVASGRALPLLALLVLSGIGAELLAAYDDTTGRPGAIAFAVVFFAALYGCPALLIRELARRTGRGWPAMVVLAAAFGLLEAGAVDQSLFADSYADVSNWEETVRATYVSPLGIAAFPAQSFVAGHVLFSFCAPVAIAEALRPEIAYRPWLGRLGVVVAVGAWLTAVGLILDDALQGGLRDPARAHGDNRARRGTGRSGAPAAAPGTDHPAGAASAHSPRSELLPHDRGYRRARNLARLLDSACRSRRRPLVAVPVRRRAWLDTRPHRGSSRPARC